MNQFLIISALILLNAALLSAQSHNLDSTDIKSGGSLIQASLPATDSVDIPRADLLTWIHNAAQAVTIYFGEFPVSHLTLEVSARPGGGVRHGMTWPRGGGLIHISVGNEVTAAQLHDDWMLTHEMTHLAFPSMPGNDHHWIEEGSATYIEPIARVMTGNMTVSELWSQFITQMPKGQPQPGDEGLDRTHTWGRTYWGGALFCLVADVEIREQTHNRKGLQDALRGVLKSGGNIDADWNIEKAFKIGDQATGVRVLETLYEQWRDKPVTVDLPQLWKRLGVSLQGDKVVFDDRAELANVRRAMTGPSTPAKAGIWEKDHPVLVGTK